VINAHQSVLIQIRSVRSRCGAVRCRVDRFAGCRASATAKTRIAVRGAAKGPVLQASRPDQHARKVFVVVCI